MPVMAGDAPHVTMIPLLGALHLRYPRYNAAVVEELLNASRPQALAIEPLPAGFERQPAWRDTEELLVPWVVVPWAERRRLRAIGVYEASPDPRAQADMARYLATYPSARKALDAAAAEERPLAGLLAEALTIERVEHDILPPLARSRALRLEAFGDGPGTDWLEARAEASAERVLALGVERTTLVAAVDRFAALREALERRGANVSIPGSPHPSEAAGERALLDLAWRGEGADPGSVVARLRALGHAEARYHAANLLLANGHVAEALEELEGVLRLDFARPPFLPALVLARLGQLRDVAGRRNDALRAYRGVMALDWAPVDARDAARAGIDAPFAFAEGGEGDPTEPDLYGA